MLAHSVRENMILAGLGRLADHGVVRSRRVDEVTRHFADKLGIRLRSFDQPVGGLSGGNQQKCVLSRWLILSTKVLILDEPTRGIDVGAKATIYQLIGDLAKEGVAIIFISSDLPEVLGMSDRIAVMSEGRIMAILDRSRGNTRTRHEACQPCLLAAGTALTPRWPCRLRRSPVVPGRRPRRQGSSEASSSTRK